MTSGFFTGDVLRGLAVRVLFFLSLALLPIGLIAISQTQQIAEQNRMNAELSLLAITDQTATAEASILQDAFGAANALASIVKLHRDDPDQCRAFFTAYNAAHEMFAMVGFIPVDGVMVCSSSQMAFDFSADPYFQQAIKEPKQRTQTIRTRDMPERPLVVITSPVFADDTLEGFIALSVPFAAFAAIKEPDVPVEPLALMTFNSDGEIISAESDLTQSLLELPQDVALQSYVHQDSAVFRAQNTQGVTRVYALRPIVTDAVFAISVWPTDTPFLNPSILNRLGAILPIVMWAASLIVAFWALNRLAIRHIRKLGRQMRRFALNRHLPRATLGASVPTELIEMEATFISMGESILRDEATLEDSLREKNILLKEVHHRVKNNLQLISSIMNLQIRQAKTSDAQRVLSRLQERILSLATVHKNLYQNEDLVQADAATLLHEVVNQLLAVGLATGSNVEVLQEYADITLEADDAAPLTLLVSEAITNALKNVSQDPRDPGKIAVALVLDRIDLARLTITNTKGGTPPEAGTGLGSNLINAFTRQLNGQVTVEDDADTYALSITFPVPQAPKARADF